MHDMIEQIIATEEQASLLCRVSTERAAEMRAEMERGATEHFEKAREDVTRENEERLEKIRATTVVLTEKKRAAANEQACRIKENAAKKIERAANLMVWGIVEKCQ